MKCRKQISIIQQRIVAIVLAVVMVGLTLTPVGVRADAHQDCIDGWAGIRDAAIAAAQKTHDQAVAAAKNTQAQKDSAAQKAFDDKKAALDLALNQALNADLNTYNAAVATANASYANSVNAARHGYEAAVAAIYTAETIAIMAVLEQPELIPPIVRAAQAALLAASAAYYAQLESLQATLQNALTAALNTKNANDATAQYNHDTSLAAAQKILDDALKADADEATAAISAADGVLTKATQDANSSYDQNIKNCPPAGPILP